MKLGALNSAIRSASAVLVPLHIEGADTQWVKVQKTDLLGVLKDVHGSARAEETGLAIDKAGRMTGFVSPAAVVSAAPQMSAPDIDLDDLLGESEPNVELEDLLG